MRCATGTDKDPIPPSHVSLSMLFCLLPKTDESTANSRNYQLYSSPSSPGPCLDDFTIRVHRSNPRVIGGIIAPFILRNTTREKHKTFSETKLYSYAGYGLHIHDADAHWDRKLTARP
ncbi:hypothetical protein BT93_A2281 [Corymbia citriodora subsp. variegata]|nr:hypothetical protein BT93_A2281 [Corymbia citriodora subsp. variegata]